jgi:predicted nucleic acid-binding protein
MATTGSVRVLVDTSAWIAYFRQEEPCFSLIAQLLEDDRICCTGLILAELLQGVRKEKEAASLRDFPQVFQFLPEQIENWIAAGSLSNRLRSKGFPVGLADCYIASVAKANGLEVLTLDRHFEILRDESSVLLVKLDPQ